MKSKERDAELALTLLRAARSKLKVMARCEEFMRSQRFFSPAYVGMAKRAQTEHNQARMCIQLARALHPATTPATLHSVRPVPPKTRPTVIDFPGLTTRQQAGRLSIRDLTSEEY